MLDSIAGVTRKLEWMRRSKPAAKRRQIAPVRYHEIGFATMKHRVLLAIGLFAAVFGAALPCAAQVASSTAAPRKLLDQYCVVCHNQRLRTANLTLDKM